jgi:hypothetical protein
VCRAVVVVSSTSFRWMFCIYIYVSFFFLCEGISVDGQSVRTDGDDQADSLVYIYVFRCDVYYGMSIIEERKKERKYQTNIK